MISFTDTHCHLNHADFADDLDAVMVKIADAHVERLICAGYDLRSSEDAVALARNFSHLRAAVGIHPHDADTFTPEVESRVRELASDRRHVTAIGEAGLDYYRCLTPHDTQHRVFRSHIRLAHQMDLPLIIHSRNAQSDVLAILIDEGMPSRGAVMHCLPDDPAFAERAIEIRCFVGLAGAITFKNAQGIRDIAARLPLDRILLETDCPYLAPHPLRGKRNDPSLLPLIAEKLAEVRGLSLAQVAEITSENARRLFGEGG